MVTPFTENLEVDYSQAALLAKKLVSEGSDGIVVSGTTGESPTLTDDEKIKLFKVIKDTVGKDITVIAGTGSNSTHHSIELTEKAEKTGVDGAMLVGPYYNKPTQKGFIKHFTEIAKNTSLPLIVYNMPGRTGSNILPDTIKELSKIDNIVAIKEASGDIEQIGEIINLVSHDCLVYSGDDSKTFPVMCLGGHGVISVASHIVGNKMKEMINILAGGNLKEARELHYHLMPAFKDLFITTSPIPVKMALNLSGFRVGGFRSPLVEADDDVVKKLEALLERYKK
jgi:4-hydroxy-tetrahydrodipicolinate synthase